MIEHTDFLDPYEVYLAKSVLNSFLDINYSIEGGFKNSERKIIIIYPEYIFKEDIEIPLSSLKIEGSLMDLSHKDYLGSVLSLGLKRNKIGDILVYEDFAIILVKDEIRDYLLYNLEKVKRNNVIVSEYILKNIEPPEENYKELTKFLSSLRLDLIISSALNVPRKKAVDFIKAENVKVNWENINKVSKEIEEKDLISVKGYGRFVLHKIKGRSKSNRFICIIRIIL